MVNPGTPKDITGIKIGRLLAIKFDHWHLAGGKNRANWKFLCDCGNTTIVSISNFLNENTSSCGCLKKEMMAAKQYKHGLNSHPLYTVHQAIIQRCHNPSAEAYKNYGGRGISVCDRWREPNGQGVINFINDMGEKPSKAHTVDRMDNNGNYEPSNCRWATRSEQGYNRRPTNNIAGKTGVWWDKKAKRWKATIGYENKEILLGFFVDLEEAVKAREEAELKYYGYLKN